MLKPLMFYWFELYWRQDHDKQHWFLQSLRGLSLFLQFPRPSFTLEMPRGAVRHFEWCLSISLISFKIMNYWTKCHANVSHFAVINGRADGLAPLGTGALTGRHSDDSVCVPQAYETGTLTLTLSLIVLTDKLSRSQERNIDISSTFF